jgi:hypothetical protein
MTRWILPRTASFEIMIVRGDGQVSKDAKNTSGFSGPNYF